MISAYLPGFDIYYSAPSENELDNRSKAMLRTFFDFWIDQNSWKDLFLKLHKLGFRAPLHNFAMKNLINERPHDTKFSAANIILPNDFFKSQKPLKEIERKAQLAF